ncbi:DNA-binding protein [bacterium]|nr:DNA-binding protein [bacterium]
MRYLKQENDYVLILNKGDKICECLKKFAKAEKIVNGFYTGIGGADELTLAYLDLETKLYVEKKYSGYYEILNLTGNFSTLNNDEFPHTHITLSDTGFNCFGGHLIEGQIAVTCEIFVHTNKTKLERKPDKDFGFNFIEL